MILSKERLIELAREARLVYNQIVHPLGVLKHHRKDLYDYARMVVEDNDRLKKKEKEENLNRN